MRRLIVAGNWKMNTLPDEGIALAKAVNNHMEQNPSDVLVIVAPPFTHLTEVRKELTVVKLSAQNCAIQESGAYTGEVAAPMIKALGAEYVIIGHSERRTIFHETDRELNGKVKIALAHDLKPIFCCGEVLPEREAGRHHEVVKQQLENAIFDLPAEKFSQLIIAYEPVWAIGTGVNATPDQAQEMHAYIRDLVREKYGSSIAENLTILYGGSCKPSNAGELFANQDVDGGLIGGASLKAEDFIAIAESF